MNPTIVTDVTYAELVALIGNLEEGLQYNITDRGIRLIAISSTQFNPDGLRTMLCPANYKVETDAYGNNWIGVWNPNRTPSANDLTIWGGLVWKNLTGAVGTKVDDFELDLTNWVDIPKATFTNHEYVEMIFNVNYDITNDWVNKQWDGYNNIFGMPKIVFNTRYPGMDNFIDICDWNYNSSGYKFYNNYKDFIYNNSAKQISDNTGSYSIFENYTSGDIVSNNNIGDINNNSCADIYDNSNYGSIKNNTGQGIYGNRNIGGIDSNSLSGEIYNNCNNGSIQNNSINGSIYQNSNNGFISNTSSLSNASVDIFNNINNGNITKQNNTTNITDTIVNKA